MAYSVASARAVEVPILFVSDIRTANWQVDTVQWPSGFTGQSSESMETTDFSVSEVVDRILATNS